AAVEPRTATQSSKDRNRDGICNSRADLLPGVFEVDECGASGFQTLRVVNQHRRRVPGLALKLSEHWKPGTHDRGYGFVGVRSSIELDHVCAAFIHRSRCCANGALDVLRKHF